MTTTTTEIVVEPTVATTDDATLSADKEEVRIYRGEAKMFILTIVIFLLFTFALALTAVILRFYPPIPKFNTSIVMTQTSNVSPTTSAVNTLTFNTTVAQTNISYDSTTGVFTALLPGMYQIEASMRFTAAVTTSTVEMWIEAGGTAHGARQAQTSLVDLSVSALIRIPSANSTWRVQVFPSTAITIAAVSGTPNFPAISITAALVSA